MGYPKSMQFLQGFPTFFQLPRPIIGAVTYTLWQLSVWSIWLGDDFYQRFWGSPSLPNDVVAFDAETGAQQWKWVGPVWRRWFTRGDEEDFWPRVQEGTKYPNCGPNPWSGPVVGVDGTIYLGNQN